jgi:phosphohistidine phosphatase
MRRLMLLRHAKSEWANISGGDHERPLNARGRDAAPRIGTYLANAKTVPDLVLCSTAARTRQTCELVTRALGTAPAIHFKDELYLAEPEVIVGLVRDAPNEVGTLMVIGHNPGIHQAAADLTGSGNDDARELLAAKFPTAALAIIDFATDDWADIGLHAGRLNRFITPRLLARKDQS